MASHATGDGGIPPRDAGERGLEAAFAQQPATAPVDIAQRGRHGLRVEGDARQAGMGEDAAMGDRQGVAVGKQPQLVGADAVGGELAAPRIAAPGVVDADRAAFALEVVLAGIEPAAAGREGAVAVEMAVGGGRKGMLHGSARQTEGQGETAGAACEDHRLAPAGTDGEAVAARRQRQQEGPRPGRREAADGIAAIGFDAGAQIERRGGGGRPRRHHRQAGGEPQQTAAVNRRRRH